MSEEYPTRSEEKIRDSFRLAWLDLKKSYLERKDQFTAIALILTVTGLFASIESDNAFLKRVQALLLFVSVCSISLFMIASFKTFFINKHSELYRAVSFTFMWISTLLIFNLFGYLFTNFRQELFFYLTWLGLPVVGVGLNLISIFSFKFFRKYKSNLHGGQIEWFFLVILNVHIINKYRSSQMEFLPTIYALVEPIFSNLVIVYIFLLTVYDEFFLQERIKTERTRILIWLAVLSVPYVIYFLL